MPEFNTRLFFRCPKCGVADAIDIEVPEFNPRSDTFEHTSEGPVVIECLNCENQFDGAAFCSPGGCKISLDEFPGMEFSGDPPTYSSFDEDYLVDYEPPKQPYRIFLETHYQMLSLLDSDIANPDDPQLLTRMIFSQLITVLEAYLADTLISHIISRKEYVINLISQDRNLKQEKIDLL